MGAFGGASRAMMSMHTRADLRRLCVCRFLFSAVDFIKNDLSQYRADIRISFVSGFEAHRVVRL